MAYLDTRVQNYNQFQILLNRDNSTQCGNAFVLQTSVAPAPLQTITPDLNFLGSGSFGAAFAVEHPYLDGNNIIKLADRDNFENVDEIDFGYIASNLVETGITPHLPLYTTCKRPNPADNPFDAQNCNCEPDVGAVGCNFQRRPGNPHGNVMNIPAWFLPNPNPIHTDYRRVNYDQRKINNCLVSFAERLDGSFKSLVNQGIIDAAAAGMAANDVDNNMIPIVLGLVAQTIFGLKAMRETPHGSWAHCDLHHENILYKHGINPGPNRDSIRYSIDGVSHYVRHNNLLYVLWDFGKVKQIRKHGHGFLGVPLGPDFDYAFLNRVFHLTGPGSLFNVVPPINAIQTDRWIASYHYDMARLLVSIHDDANTMPRTKLVCRVLYKHFIILVNGGNTAINRNVDPITFIMLIFNILTAHLNANPMDAPIMNQALNAWTHMMNNPGGVPVIPPPNQILKRYPIVPAPPAPYHFGKSKKSPKKSVRKSKRSPKKSVRKAKAKKSPKKSVRKAKKSPKKDVKEKKFVRKEKK